MVQAAMITNFKTAFDEPTQPDIQRLFQEYLKKGHPDIDAICLATAVTNGHSEDKAFYCTNRKVACPNCPFEHNKDA